MALRIVRDAVVEQREAAEGGACSIGITAPEVWAQLCVEMTEQGRKPAGRRSVLRWLNRWVEDGILLKGSPRLVSKARTPTYITPADPQREADVQALLSFCDKGVEKPVGATPEVLRPLLEDDGDFDWAADQEDEIG